MSQNRTSSTCGKAEFWLLWVSCCLTRSSTISPEFQTFTGISSEVHQNFIGISPDFRHNIELEHLKKGDNHNSAFPHQRRWQSPPRLKLFVVLLFIYYSLAYSCLCVLMCLCIICYSLFSIINIWLILMSIIITMIISAIIICIVSIIIIIIIIIITIIMFSISPPRLRSRLRRWPGLVLIIINKSYDNNTNHSNKAIYVCIYVICISPPRLRSRLRRWPDYL